MKKLPLFFRYTDDEADDFQRIGIANSEEDAESGALHFVGHGSVQGSYRINKGAKGYYVIIKTL
jgi:hypothetical protein